jgi:hypothetical protein
MSNEVLELHRRTLGPMIRIGKICGYDNGMELDEE